MVAEGRMPIGSTMDRGCDKRWDEAGPATQRREVCRARAGTHA